MMDENFSIIKKCRCSDSTDYRDVFSIPTPVPLAGSFCSSYSEAIHSPQYPLTFVVFEDSGVIQCLESIRPEAIFLKYKYDSSTIPALVKHFGGLAEKLVGRYGGDNKVKLLEIGANSFPLLNQLPSNWELTGVDPSDVAANAKRNNNIEFFNKFFSSEFVAKNNMVGKYKVVVASNCLAHIPQIQDIFRGIWLALEDDGEFIIEVKDGDTILDMGEIFDCYHEHPVQYTTHSLQRVLGKVGFKMVEQSVLPFHGGLLHMVLKKTKNPINYPLPSNYFESVIRRGKAMQRTYDNRETNLMVAEMRFGGKKNVAYGASGKATMMLNAYKNIRFDYIVDESPSKIGLFIPGVGTPIVSKETLENDRSNKNILVCAWNYYDNILKANSHIQNAKWFNLFAK